MHSGTSKLVKDYIFNIDTPLGKGQFSTVYKAQNKIDKNIFALKVMPLNEINRDISFAEIVENEFKVFTALEATKTCQYIVHLIEWFRTEKYLYMVTEFCDGGDLEQYSKKKGPLPESKVIEILRQFITGYLEVHKLKIMHRDIKLSNLMLHKGKLKITDFGFSKIFEKFYEPVRHSIKGTPLTMAPQVFRGDDYTEKCDVWSLGVVLYQLLYNATPWDHSDGMSNYFQRIMNDQIRFNRKVPVSDWMKQFIVKCLSFEESNRLSWEDIQRHPLITGGHPSLLTRNPPLQANQSNHSNNITNFINTCNNNNKQHQANFANSQLKPDAKALAALNMTGNKTFLSNDSTNESYQFQVDNPKAETPKKAKSFYVDTSLGDYTIVKPNNKTVDINDKKHGHFTIDYRLLNTSSNGKGASTTQILSEFIPYANDNSINASDKGPKQSVVITEMIIQTKEWDLSDNAPTVQPFKSGDTPPLLGLTEVMKMLDDYNLVRENLFSNFNKNLLLIQSLCAQMGKASYLLASKESFFNEKNLTKQSSVLGLFFLVMRLVLVKRYIHIFSEAELGVLKEQSANHNAHHLASAIEGVRRNDNVYSKYFCDYVKNLTENTKSFKFGNEGTPEEVEFSKYLESAKQFDNHPQQKQGDDLSFLIPTRGLLLKFALPFVEALLSQVGPQKPIDNGSHQRDTLLLADHILDFLVFFTLLKDLLNGSNLPFLKDFMNQTTQSKDLLNGIDPQIGVQNLHDKKRRIMALISVDVQCQ